MRMIPMRKLFKKWPKWLIKWVSVMRLPGSNCLRLNYLLILSKMEKSRKRKQINKKLCSKICLIISRRSMMSRSKMHQKLNRKRKIKGNWRFRNFRKGLKLFKGSMKKLARSRSRNSKKTKCRIYFIQVEALIEQVLASSYCIRIIGWSSTQEKVHWNRNSDDHSQAKDWDDELIQEHEGGNWEQDEKWTRTWLKVG